MTVAAGWIGSLQRLDGTCEERTWAKVVGILVERNGVFFLGNCVPQGEDSVSGVSGCA